MARPSVGNVYEPIAPVKPYEDHLKVIEPYFYNRKSCPSSLESFKCLLKAINQWTKLTEGQLAQVQLAAEKLLSACALLDDLYGECVVREGLAAAYTIYGVPLTVNCADYLYFDVLENLLDALPQKQTQAATIYIDHMMTVHAGTDTYVDWTETGKVPTEAEYEQVVQKRLGSVLQLFVQEMQLFTGNKLNLSPLVKPLALWLQIKADYERIKNLCERNKTSTFAVCQRLSFPVLHAARHAHWEVAVIDFLRGKPAKGALKQQIVARLEATGSMAYTANKLAQLTKQIAEETAKLGGNGLLEKLIATAAF